MDQLGASTGERPCYKNKLHACIERRGLCKTCGLVSLATMENSTLHSRRTAQNDIAYFLSCLRFLGWDCAIARKTWFRETKCMLSLPRLWRAVRLHLGSCCSRACRPASVSAQSRILTAPQGAGSPLCGGKQGEGEHPNPAGGTLRCT